MRSGYLNKVQLRTELEKCLQCPTKPCKDACPVSCSPHDFIVAAKQNNWQNASRLIIEQNPLGEACGLICPDKFCMRACLRKNLDQAILIPSVQASILKYARQQDIRIPLENTVPNHKKIAVIGLGPSGIGAISELLKHGFHITAYEKQATIGGALNLIPEQRLPREVLQFEWQRLEKNPLLDVHFNTLFSDYAQLLHSGYNAVIVSVGEQKNKKLNIPGESLIVNYTDYLQNPKNYQTKGHILIIGGGAVAVDCAVTASKLGSHHVEMLVRRRIGDMRITAQERLSLLENNIDITTMTRLTHIAQCGNYFTAHTVRTEFDPNGKLQDVPNTLIIRENLSLIISALGSTCGEELIQDANIFYAGDCINGGSTAVEAIASGKAVAQQIIAKFA